MKQLYKEFTANIEINYDGSVALLICSDGKTYCYFYKTVMGAKIAWHKWCIAATIQYFKKQRRK